MKTLFFALCIAFTVAANAAPQAAWQTITVGTNGGGGGTSGIAGTLINTNNTLTGQLAKFLDTNGTNVGPASVSDIQAAIGPGVYGNMTSTGTPILGDIAYWNGSEWQGTNSTLSFIGTNSSGFVYLLPTAGITATNTVSSEKIFGIAAASGYTGNGENFLLDDDHYTNFISQVEVGTLTQTTGGMANWLVGYDSNTNFVPATASMVTNALGDAGILTAALSATNATQLVNLAQLESAVAGNAVLYFDTSTASAANGFTLTGTVRATNYSSTALPAASTNAAFTASNGQYIAGFISTNTYSRLASGLAHVELYVIDNSAGTGDIATEFYLVNSVTKAEEVEFTPSPAYQTVPTGATPTKLTFAIPFSDYNSTTNFHILVKIKLIESGTDPTIRIVTGGAFSSHIAFTLPSSFFAPINSPTFTGVATVPDMISLWGVPTFDTTNVLADFASSFQRSFVTLSNDVQVVSTNWVSGKDRTLCFFTGTTNRNITFLQTYQTNWIGFPNPVTAYLAKSNSIAVLTISCITNNPVTLLNFFSEKLP